MVDTWRYPANWRVISRRIRERDGFRCRWCGAREDVVDLLTGRRVQLTTMHLDGDPSNCEEWNLVAACRPYHAAYDAPDASAGRARTRHWKLIEAGQLELFPEFI